jgi:hypothetical protein
MIINKKSAFGGISLMIVFLLASACRKSTTITGSPKNGSYIVDTSSLQVDTSSQPLDKFPAAFAGNDTTIRLPVDYFVLNGNYSTPNKLGSVEWKNLTCSACIIEKQNSLNTKVTGLERGNLQFELTVFDKLGRYGKDTITVLVLPPKIIVSSYDIIVSANDVTFKNLQWFFPWYSTLEIRDIYSYVQPGTSFKVFIQRGSGSDWVEVQPISDVYTDSKYEYFIETRPDGAGMYTYGSLIVFYYGMDADDRPKIKVEF